MSLKRLLLLLSLSFVLPGAGAQTSFPTKPILIIIPLAPGGGSEAETRMLAQKITELEGYNFVVDYKAGGGGTIASAYVAKSAPDGHTLMQLGLGNILAPLSYADLTYDPIKDFQPITLTTKRPVILMVHPSLPVKTVREYIEYARNNPGKIAYGTGPAGGSTHLPGAWLHHATKTEVTFVHYKSSGAYLPDLFSGRLQAAAGTPTNAIAAMKAGKLRGLAVSSKERLPSLPDLPSIGEVVPDYDYSTWIGYTGPRGIPAQVVSKLNAAFIRALRDPSVNQKLVSGEIIPVGNSSEEFNKMLMNEAVRWTKFVKETGITLSE